jgi:hypothetical protein
MQSLGLADTYTHDLLARIIFVQFLFDRKDSDGRAALDAEWLGRFYAAGQLSAPHSTLAEVLGNADDTYALFRELNRRFNGDLFPPVSNPDAWAEERKHIGPQHLDLLAEFVDARGDFATGQLSLWRRYAFDAIPLDVISSIYEEFVSGHEGVGVHYTPGHVADHILDRVLPWHGTEWNIRILDPACGSGIFLVKAYQRLVYRWRRAHSEQVPVTVLRDLLTQNIFGVDTDGGAVRVTAFSLYLAMCDEIDPKHLWEHPETVFPPLRGERIIEDDFFNDRLAGLHTERDAGTYHLVVGNPPWGDRTLQTSEYAAEWTRRWGWDVANKDFGTLFLAKAAELAREGGHVALVQSASAVLYNDEPTARKLQRRIFTQHRRITGVTLFPPRLPLFRGARVPTCVVYLENRKADGSPFLFEAPKRQRTSLDQFALVLDPGDVHWITPDEVVREPWIWSVLAWGGARDRILIRRLRKYSTLGTLVKPENRREGLNRGDRAYPQEELRGRRYLGDEHFPAGPTFMLDGEALPLVEDVCIDSRASRSLAAFRLPQLLLKRSLIKADLKFQARVVVGEAVVPEKMYVSVHAGREVVDAACLIYNSDLATYYLFLTSGRFAFDRNNPNVRDLLEVPLPADGQCTALSALRTPAELQARAFDALKLSEADRILVEDLVAFTFSDERGLHGHGRSPTRPGLSDAPEPDLFAYGATYRRVVQAAYGPGMRVRVEIAIASDGYALPVRLVRLVIGPAVPDTTVFEMESVRAAYERLADAYRAARRNSSTTLSLRCARAYEVERLEGEPHLIVTYIKPDQIRFWSRSLALRDADDLAVDLAAWSVADRMDPQTEVLLG